MIPITAKPKRFPASLRNIRNMMTMHGGMTTSFRHLARGLRPHASEWKFLKAIPTVRFNYISKLNASSFVSQPAACAFSTKVELSTHTIKDIHADYSSASKRSTNATSATVRGQPLPAFVSELIYAKAPIEALAVKPLNLHGAREAGWWTGKAPQFGVCPGVEADGRIYSIPQATFHANTTDALEATKIRSSLQSYFDNTWALTEVLLGSLQGEEAFTRPPYHDLRHPMIFYYGHPAALYINKLRVAGLLDKPINAYFEVIFETGVDEMSWDDLSKNKMAWPSVKEVHAYRKQVYDTVTDLIGRLTDEQCCTLNQQSPLWALVMAFEHERIHIETSSFLISELPLEFVRFPEGFPAYHPSAVVASNAKPLAAGTISKLPLAGVNYPINSLIEVPETTVTIGKPREFPSFGWDNEYGQRTFTVPTFKASEFKVTNGEFLEFMQDGGYARNELWTAAGWEWRAFRNVKMPTHFLRTGPQGSHEYALRLLFDTVAEVPWDWPVVVNLHEASAFAKWKSIKTGKHVRVMTELEHRAIRDKDQMQALEVPQDPVTLVGGNKMMQQVGYNTNLSCASMSPVNALKPNSKGFYDVFGNAWEWTADYFCALPGFQVHPYYEDFSTPCFDGLHHVIQGGSFISTGNECSAHARFHFRPHFHQHASFRVVEVADTVAMEDRMLTSDTDAPGPYVGSYPFRRTQKSLQQSMAAADALKLHQQRNSVLLKHFAVSPLSATGKSVMADFGDRILSQARSVGVDLQKAHIIEVGSGPGGLTFALASQCGVGASVIGIEHSAHETEVARKLLRREAVTATLSGEGSAITTLSLSTTAVPCKVDFRTADPMCLPAEMQLFDVVVLHDVLDTLASPNALLGRLGGVRGLVKPQGLLVVSSAYQWDENCTPRGLWLGGYNDASGNFVKSEVAIVERLSGDFTHVKTEPLAQVWPESQRNLRGNTYSLSFFVRK